MYYYLTNDEKKRLVETIRAVYAIPFIDDIEDYIWEAIFAYVKNVPTVDPLTNIRSKRLFDMVDKNQKIGWSLKAGQRSIHLPCEFEVVIQRADIFKKANLLGFDSLSIHSPVEHLGEALLKHWYDQKVTPDALFQGVEDKRVCILLKAPNRKDYVYLEQELVEYEANDLAWEWTDNSKTGLQARRVHDGQLIFRWYPNQKQFFERFTFPTDSYVFSIQPVRLEADDVVAFLLAKVADKL
jgi:hypothetical protein